ncbi:MAG TPA: hypothetical protein VE944_25925 [Nostoc sp.]|nr:hypothetical protein [Nostoc sp.]HYX17732.1 hypothetical protein [Nostoc sp.]
MRKLIGRLAAQAGLDIKVHCHMMDAPCLRLLSGKSGLQHQGNPRLPGTP